MRPSPPSARWFLLLAALLSGLACSLFSPPAPPTPTRNIVPPTPTQTSLTPGLFRPADFTVTYDWREGTLAPPYYYQYTIVVAADGAVTLTFMPGYPGDDDVPVWVETLTLDTAQHDALYTALVGAGLFSIPWEAQGDPPVGGGSEWLTVVANSVTLEVPAYVLDDQADAQGALSAIVKALIPLATWDDLQARRDQYVADYQE